MPVNRSSGFRISRGGTTRRRVTLVSFRARDFSRAAGQIRSIRREPIGETLSLSLNRPSHYTINSIFNYLRCIEISDMEHQDEAHNGILVINLAEEADPQEIAPPAPHNDPDPMARPLPPIEAVLPQPALQPLFHIAAEPRMIHDRPPIGLLPIHRPIVPNNEWELRRLRKVLAGEIDRRDNLAKRTGHCLTTYLESPDGQEWRCLNCCTNVNPRWIVRRSHVVGLLKTSRLDRSSRVTPTNFYSLRKIFNLL